jgi:aspartate/glutamate racemase
VTKGIYTNETIEKYLSIINELTREGVEGIIFGCTELPMLIKQEECTIVTFDTTLIHASAAVEFALT